MIKKYFWLWLIVIILIGGVLRMIGLDKNPPHIGNDEISIAFDSYSLRTTGKDGYGIKWPLSFRSHRDYKAPLYAYLNMPFNFIFGNNEYGIRFLSALVGTLGILMVALMGRFFKKEELGLIAAVLLALNPKAVFVSIMAYESNLGMILTSLGVYLLFLFREKPKKWYLILSGLFFGFSIWAYHTQKGLVPLLLVALPWLCRKEIKLRKWFLLWLTAFLVILPIFLDFINVQMKDPYNRASSQIWFQSASIQNYLKETNDNFFKKVVKVSVDPVYRYLNHFNLNYNFTDGMDLFPKNEPFNFGWCLITTLPLLIVGLFNLKTVFGKYKGWILTWWLLCPIVPSLTWGDLASVRNLPFLIPTILIMAGGGWIILNKNKKTAALIGLLSLINFGYFGIAYYNHFPKISGDNFQYGYKQAWEFIKPIEKDYEKIIIEPRFGNTGQYSGLPELYFGYFGAFGAIDMQNKDYSLNRIGKYWVRNIDWNQELVEKNSLYVVAINNSKVGKYYDNLELIDTINKPNGDPQFLIYKTVGL